MGWRASEWLCSHENGIMQMASQSLMLRSSLAECCQAHASTASAMIDGMHHGPEQKLIHHVRYCKCSSFPDPIRGRLGLRSCALFKPSCGHDGAGHGHVLDAAAVLRNSCFRKVPLFQRIVQRSGLRSYLRPFLFAGPESPDRRCPEQETLQPPYRPLPTQTSAAMNCGRSSRFVYIAVDEDWTHREQDLSRADDGAGHSHFYICVYAEAINLLTMPLWLLPIPLIRTVSSLHYHHTT
ncbi:hypothetical protein Mapa_012563 [Marchantia paleacea]|nr:hypothetical protein Mapa_012563 [Marchantia paleacea]